MRSVYKYLVLAVIITSGYAATKNTKMTDESIIVNWIDAIGKIPAGHFVGVADSSALPNPAKEESPRWAGQVFLPGMGPYDLIRKPKHSYVCNETDLDLLRDTVAGLGVRATLQLIPDADHAFHVPAKTGRRDLEVLADALAGVAAWILQR